MSLKDKINENPKLGWLLFGGSLAAVFALGLLASSITERRMEAAMVSFANGIGRVAEFEPRNEVWGKYFPREFESYYNTADTSFRSQVGGSATVDALEEDPRLVVLWAGYAFSKDYNQGRGHYYAIEDISNSLRTAAPKDANDGPLPSTCWTCKSPDVPRLMNEHGVTEFYTGKWARLGGEVVNPIGCGDCHDPKTMNLTITRPALIEAFERQGKDINKATHQEMRSLVCAQCHVEYYFDKKRPGAEGAQYLTFPWDKGFTVEAMEAYFDEHEFSDWTHAISKTPMIKAQHPDYEIHMMGIHGQRGVSCADCHMPYKSEGGQKFTDHHIQSPLNNVANSCQVCHRESEETLIKNVYDRQNQCKEIKINLEDALVRAHYEAGKAWELGATEAQMQAILKDIRHAQWRWDFGVASHGGAFHAPTETARILSSGLAKAESARVKLARLLAGLGYNQEVAIPDISTKAKAQKAIGLDMEKLHKEKESFNQNLRKQWEQEAKERESKYDEKFYSASVK